MLFRSWSTSSCGSRARGIAVASSADGFASSRLLRSRGPELQAAEAPPAPPRMLPGRCFRSREVGGSERASIVVPLNCVNRHHVTRGFRPGREWLHGAPIRAQRAPLQAGRLVLSSRSPREELLGQTIAFGSSMRVREGIGMRRSRGDSLQWRSRCDEDAGRETK